MPKKYRLITKKYRLMMDMQTANAYASVVVVVHASVIIKNAFIPRITSLALIFC